MEEILVGDMHIASVWNEIKLISPDHVYSHDVLCYSLCTFFQTSVASVPWSTYYSARPHQNQSSQSFHNLICVDFLLLSQLPRICLVDPSSVRNLLQFEKSLSSLRKCHEFFSWWIFSFNYFWPLLLLCS